MKKIILLILILFLTTACGAKNVIPGEAETVDQLNEDNSGRAFDFNYDGPNPDFLLEPQK